MAPGNIEARVEGVNELVDKIVVLTRIHVHYTLRLPEGTPRDKVDRALETHVAKCPTAKSLEGAVAVSWSVDLIEEP
jgi:uncharacterized OsmC-like protein